jgi:hypothetical protein
MTTHNSNHAESRATVFKALLATIPEADHDRWLARWQDAQDAAHERWIRDREYEQSLLGVARYGQ